VHPVGSYYTDNLVHFWRVKQSFIL